LSNFYRHNRELLYLMRIMLLLMARNQYAYRYKRVGYEPMYNRCGFFINKNTVIRTIWLTEWMEYKIVTSKCHYCEKYVAYVLFVFPCFVIQFLFEAPKYDTIPEIQIILRVHDFSEMLA
jgi:hypothetical protein